MGPRKSLAAGWTNTPPSIANSRPLTTKCPDIREPLTTKCPDIREPLTTKCPDTNYHTIFHRDHPFISSFFFHFITLMNGVFCFFFFFKFLYTLYKCKSFFLQACIKLSIPPPR